MKIKRLTASTNDYIKVNVLNDATKVIYPLLPNIINTVVRVNKYPQNLQLTRIIPANKKGKDNMKIEGWRALNIVSALSKLIDIINVQQLIEYLIKKNIINPNHHGLLPSKSTLTLMTNDICYQTLH